jgi:surfeit locus 1 family protein
VVGLLSPESEDGYVRQWEPYTGSIERHIGYAIQWFLMALVLAFIGIRLALKQRKN